MGVSEFGLVRHGPADSDGLAARVASILPSGRCSGTWSQQAPSLATHSTRQMLQALMRGGHEGVALLLDGGFPSLEMRASFYEFIASIPEMSEFRGETTRFKK